MLTERRPLLDKVAEGLLERETLDAHDLEILLQGGELPLLALPATEAAPDADGVDKSEGKARETPELSQVLGWLRGVLLPTPGS